MNHALSTTPPLGQAESDGSLQLLPASDPWNAVFWDGELHEARLEPVAAWALCKVVGSDGKERTRIVGLIQTDDGLDAPEYLRMSPGSAILGYCPKERALDEFMSIVDPTGHFKRAAAGSIA